MTNVRVPAPMFSELKWWEKALVVLAIGLIPVFLLLVLFIIVLVIKLAVII